MSIFVLWILSMIATIFIADQKKFGVLGYFFLSLFLGPLAVIIVLAMSSREVKLENNRPEENSLEYAKRQLQDLRSSLSVQEARISGLENLINKLSASAPEVPFEKMIKPEPILEKFIQVAPVEIQRSSMPEKKTDMELDFGRNWLSKIGVVVLALGMAFLISYTFKYFGPFLKIAFGFLVGGGLFFAGTKLEAQEKLMHYGRALMGGAWAIVYFTTYAMYHFEASRIVFNQGVDLFLLSLVVLGMILHTLRYRSEEMMALALFAAYLTSTMGQITNFTVISNLFLAALILFLVYKFQWVKILSLGLIMTYGIHYIWVVPHIGVNASSDPDLMNFIFLTSYWLFFFIGVHLIRSVKDPAHLRALAATNFGNIALYSVLSYPIVLHLFYDQRFAIVLTEGLVYLASALIMKKRQQEKMYISDMVAAVFAITFSLSLKFFPATTLLLWFIEVPCLLFIGISFKERIFNYFSYALSAVAAIRLVFLSWSGGTPDMYFWAGISMAACFYLTQRSKENPPRDSIDTVFDQIFSFASCFYFSNWVWSLVHQPWIAFSLSMEGYAFLMISIWLGLRRFRAYAYLAFAFSAAIFLSEHIYASSEFLKWFIVTCNVLAVFGVYHAVRYFRRHKPGELLLEHEEVISFVLGLVLLVFSIFQYVNYQWITLSLGIASVVLILTGFMSGNKIERMGGMAVLALTLGRVVLVDLSGLDIIFKIITLIVLGVLFLGVSYIYNRFSIKNKEA